jgi:hypothetical protein
MLRLFDLRLRLILMRRFAEDGFEQSDEVKARKLRSASDLVH